MNKISQQSNYNQQLNSIIYNERINHKYIGYKELNNSGQTRNESYLCYISEDRMRAYIEPDKY